MKKLLILTNSINGLYSFRRELVETLIKKGYEVTISSPKDVKSSYFAKIGCGLIYTSINRRGTNPIKDFKLLVNYLRIINRIKPNVVLTYTIKPNVNGGLACRLLGVPYIANITGLGTSIENKGLIRILSLTLYKIGLKKASCIFFQNESNRKFFVENRVISNIKAKGIPGSGVNLKQHSFEEYPGNNGTLRFLFIGRIMKAKGVEELFEVAKAIKNIYKNIQFHVVGKIEENYNQTLDELQNKQIIKFYGHQENVHEFIKNSHATILPSYHEGMSNVLLESAATGRPVLASRVPGCKETFDEGISGFGFEPKNVDSLVKTIIKFSELPYEKKKQMGIAGRRKMEKEFDRNIVIKAYLEEIDKIVKQAEGELL